jgi:hypothetical protein
MVVRHILILVGLTVVLTAVAMWLGLGPVVHSWAA